VPEEIVLRQGELLVAARGLSEMTGTSPQVKASMQEIASISTSDAWT
jgi:hypothetical protein